MVEYLLSFSWTSREECERLVAASWLAGVELLLFALPCFACPVSLCVALFPWYCDGVRGCNIGYQSISLHSNGLVWLPVRSWLEESIENMGPKNIVACFFVLVACWCHRFESDAPNKTIIAIILVLNEEVINILGNYALRYKSLKTFTGSFVLEYIFCI